MKKIKYIIKKIFIIFLISFISIIIYQIFMELKSTSNNQNNYGTRLSAEEEIKEEKQDISSIIEKASSAVVGVSKIKNIWTVRQIAKIDVIIYSFFF